MREDRAAGFGRRGPSIAKASQERRWFCAGRYRSKRKRCGWLIALAGCALFTAGCQTGEVVQRWQATSPGTRIVAQDDVRLASEVAADPTPLASSAPAATAPTTRPASPQTRPVTKLPYTAPAANVQAMSFLTLATTTTSLSATLAGGKEAAESKVTPSARTSLGPVGGISSLGAPQPRTLNAIVGQPGLQHGFALGLGLAPPHNLFTRQVIPLSGPGGRCQQLVNAGFFSSLSACQCHFGHCARR